MFYMAMVRDEWQYDLRMNKSWCFGMTSVRAVNDRLAWFEYFDVELVKLKTGFVALDFTERTFQRRLSATNIEVGGNIRKRRRTVGSCDIFS